MDKRDAMELRNNLPDCIHLWELEWGEEPNRHCSKCGLHVSIPKSWDDRGQYWYDKEKVNE